MSFSVADLHEIADAYDPTLAKAPLVVGHPKVEDPAYGWAARLSVDGDTLFAESDQVEAQFAAMVHDGRFPNRSASIFLPNTPGNPKPGRLYLKHIGFLGAAAPAVTGLAPVPATFAAGGEAVTFSFPLTQEAPMPLKDPTATAASAPAPATSSPASNDAVSFAAQVASRTAALDQREAELRAREQQITAAASAAVRDAAVSFAAHLVQDGKVLPAQQETVVELLVALPGADAPVQFAQGSATVSRPARDLLRELLDGMPARIQYREKSAGRDVPAAASFAAPVGTMVDAGRADQFARIQQLQAANPNLSVVDAARMVGA